MNGQIVKRLYHSTLTVQFLTILAAYAGTLVDGMIVGSCLGVSALTVYGLVTPVISLLMGIASVFEAGVSVLCSNCIGAGDRKQMNRVLNQALLFSFLCSLLLILLVFTGAVPIAAMLGAREPILQETADYLKGVVLSSPFLIWGVMLLPIMQLDGDRKRAIHAVFFIFTVNIAADLLNVFVIHGGLLGIALATVLSYFSGLLILLLHFRENTGMFRLRFQRPEGKVLRRVFSYGLLRALEYVLKGILLVTMNHILLAVSGSQAVAAYSAIYTLSILCTELGMSAGQTVSLLTGLFSGEKDVESIRELLSVAIHTSIRDNLIVSVIVLLVAPVMIRPFLPKDPEIIRMGITGLRYFALCISMYAVNSILRGYCRAMRYFRVAYGIVFLGNFFSVAACAMLLSRIAGLTGVWLSHLAGEILTLLAYLLPAVLRDRRKTRKRKVSIIDAIMRMDPEFTKNILAAKSWSCRSEKEVMAVSKEVQAFCRGQDGTGGSAFFMSLSVEELCMNIIQYGFANGKNHSIDVKVMREPSGWILRIRDDCDQFDPVHYRSSDSPGEHLGIRMITGLANRMEYTNSFRLNNLLIEIEEQDGLKAKYK